MRSAIGWLVVLSDLTLKGVIYECLSQVRGESSFKQSVGTQTSRSSTLEYHESPVDPFHICIVTEMFKPASKSLQGSIEVALVARVEQQVHRPGIDQLIPPKCILCTSKTSPNCLFSFMSRILAREIGGKRGQPGNGWTYMYMYIIYIYITMYIII